MSETAFKEKLSAAMDKLVHIEKAAIKDRGDLLRMRNAAAKHRDELSVVKKKVKEAVNRRNVAISERNDLERELRQELKQKGKVIDELSKELITVENQVAGDAVIEWESVATWIGTIDEATIDLMRKALSARAKDLRETAKEE
jgi:uncharacterized protein YPO0396